MNFNFENYLYLFKLLLLNQNNATEVWLILLGMCSKKTCFLKENELFMYYLHSAYTYYIDPFNVCKHRKPRLGARAAWGQKNGAANRPAYCVKEKQTSLIDR